MNHHHQAPVVIAIESVLQYSESFDDMIPLLLALMQQHELSLADMLQALETAGAPQALLVLFRTGAQARPARPGAQWAKGPPARGKKGCGCAPVVDLCGQMGGQSVPQPLTIPTIGGCVVDGELACNEPGKPGLRPILGMVTVPPGGVATDWVFGTARSAYLLAVEFFLDDTWDPGLVTLQNWRRSTPMIGYETWGTNSTGAGQDSNLVPVPATMFTIAGYLGGHAYRPNKNQSNWIPPFVSAQDVGQGNATVTVEFLNNDPVNAFTIPMVAWFDFRA